VPRAPCRRPAPRAAAERCGVRCWLRAGGCAGSGSLARRSCCSPGKRGCLSVKVLKNNGFSQACSAGPGVREVSAGRALADRLRLADDGGASRLRCQARQRAWQTARLVRVAGEVPASCSQASRPAELKPAHPPAFASDVGASRRRWQARLRACQTARPVRVAGAVPASCSQASRQAELKPAPLPASARLVLAGGATGVSRNSGAPQHSHLRSAGHKIVV